MINTPLGSLRVNSSLLNMTPLVYGTQNGSKVVGAELGETEGPLLGDALGVLLGETLGVLLGETLGDTLGCSEGEADGQIQAMRNL